MPKFYHVTKLDKVRNIKSGGLKPSSGMAAGGMSSDSNEAYKYAAQDKNLIYLWTDEDYTDKFKKEGLSYAMIIADVDEQFVTQHMGPTPVGLAAGNIGDPIPETATTAVCNAIIPVEKLSYKKTEDGDEIPLVNWGVFSMTLDRADTTIWEGQPL
jgi:hypothetical protein